MCLFDIVVVCNDIAMKTMVLLGAQMRQKAGQVNWFIIGNQRNSKLALNLLAPQVL